MKEDAYPALEAILKTSSELHRHLCPRQVLGARIGLYGLNLLGIHPLQETKPFDNERKQLLSIVETDGCGADGLSAATNCWVGRRTLRVVDFGKVAATLVDTRSGRALRISPAPDIRLLARETASEARSRWHAYLEAYRFLPDEELLRVEKVTLTESIESILSRPRARAFCVKCGEEILNERERVINGEQVCRSCAGESYYKVTP